MTIGVMLMTFGSAVTPEGVPAYLRSVRGGSDPSAEGVAEFQRRYSLIGRSPLIEITGAQAEGLQRLLDSQSGPGAFAVRSGMLHSSPGIDAGVAALSVQCSHIIGIILSPQYAVEIMAAYDTVFAAACGRYGVSGAVAGPWYMEESFQAAVAEKVAEALDGFGPTKRDTVPVIFTAHSMPQRVVDRNPEYVASLHDTAARLAAASGLSEDRWRFAYQSAGHTAEEWLRPDFKELLPGLRAAGWTEVLIVPTQFVADHLEVLYDIDIAGAEEARDLGMTFRRSQMPNASPRFVRALADVVAREWAAVSDSVRVTAESASPA